MHPVPIRSASGFTVKSGWASAVLVTETDGSPRVADSRRVELSDPGIPESRQPYHAGFGKARDGGPELAGTSSPPAGAEGGAEHARLNL
jgi:hypothetical protein